MALARTKAGMPFWVGRNYGATPPPPAAWAPDDVAGLLFWFKADSGVTQAGGLVSQWDVQPGCVVSTNGTAAGATRPTYTAGVLNGKPGITFPAGTEITFGSDLLFDPAAGFTLVFVAQNSNPGGTYYNGFMKIRATVGGRCFSGIFSNDPSYASVNFGYIPRAGFAAAVIKSTGDFTTSPNSMVMTYDGVSPTSASSWGVDKNAVAQTTSSGGTSQADTTLNGLGDWAAGGLPFLGTIFEVFAYNTKLSAGDLTEVNNYVQSAARWGVL